MEDARLNAALGQIVLPMVTPFRQGAVDLQAAQRMALHYVDAGVAGLVLSGSTGEGNLVSVAEQADLLGAVRESVSVPILIGVGGVDTRNIIDAIDRLDRYRPSAYLVPPPYYLRPAQSGIVWHYTTITEATATPVVLYDVAARTGSAMTIQTMNALNGLPTIIGAKVCDAGVLATLDEQRRFPVYCGEDRALMPHLSLGGAISAAAHVRPDLFVALAALARGGKIAQAEALFKSLKPLIRLLYAEPNPAPIKGYLARQGMLVDELRRPMMSASQDLVRRIERVAQRLPAIGAWACAA